MIYSNKVDNEYFEDLDDLEFKQFIRMMNQCFTAYNSMLEKLLKLKSLGQSPSVNHLYKMRQLSVDVEKFGKYFRKKTIKFERSRKEKPFDWTEPYKIGSKNVSKSSPTA